MECIYLAIHAAMQNPNVETCCSRVVNYIYTSPTTSPRPQLGALFDRGVVLRSRGPFRIFEYLPR